MPEAAGLAVLASGVVLARGVTAQAAKLGPGLPRHARSVCQSRATGLCRVA